MPKRSLFSSWALFDRIGSFFSSNNINDIDRPISNSPDLNEVANDSVRSGLFGLQEGLSLKYNRFDRYKDYDRMDECGELSLALDMYADECSLISPETGHVIKIDSDDLYVKNELESLWNDILMWDTRSQSIARDMCKYGDRPMRIVLSKNRDSVIGLVPLNIYGFRRLETPSGLLVGFFAYDDYTSEPMLLHPWEVVHFRLETYDNKFYPYGRSIIEGSRRPYKQLTMTESGVIIHRLTRSSQRFKFEVPVGRMPSEEIPEHMAKVAAAYKNKKFYNPATQSFDERYIPLTLEDDFFLARRPDGSGPDVNVLAGSDNLSSIADIEFFQRKMILPTKITPERLGIGSAKQANKESLSQTDSEFGKSVSMVKMCLIHGIRKVSLVHLALKRTNASKIKSFDITLDKMSSTEELYRMESWQTRVNVMSDLKAIGWFPIPWILKNFTDLSGNEIWDIVAFAEQNAAMGGGEDGMGGGGGGGGLSGLGSFDDVMGEDPSLSGVPDMPTDEDLAAGQGQAEDVMSTDQIEEAVEIFEKKIKDESVRQRFMILKKKLFESVTKNRKTSNHNINQIIVDNELGSLNDMFTTQVAGSDCGNLLVEEDNEYEVEDVLKDSDGYIDGYDKLFESANITSGYKHSHDVDKITAISMADLSDSIKDAPDDIKVMLESLRRSIAYECRTILEDEARLPQPT